MFAQRSVPAVAVLALALSGLGLQPEIAKPTARDLERQFEGIKSIARPSRDSTMGFPFPSEIAEVLVQGGVRVKLGDPLVRANAEEAQAQRDLQKLVADSDLDVQRAQVAKEQAEVEFKGQEELRRDGGGTPIEYDRARTTLDARKVELRIAELNREQQVIQLRFRESQLERYVLRAPFDGVVDLVQTDAGEVKKDGDPVIRVVNTDPLWIDVFTPTLQTLTLRLKPGDPSWVLMDLPGEARVYQGKVVELAAEADSSAGLRRVRVELPNPEDWPAGLTAWVRFSQPTGEWVPRIVKREGIAAAGSSGDSR
jgi:RND family efflux transporter MFP subunit